MAKELVERLIYVYDYLELAKIDVLLAIRDVGVERQDIITILNRAVNNIRSAQNKIINIIDKLRR